jgi:hypothetical protein
MIADFGVWNQLILGALIVITVLFFRGGLWGGIRMLTRLGLRYVGLARATKAPQPGPAE